MGKANISFPDGLLEEIDRRAAAEGTSRSGFVQEATTLYIAEIDSRAEHEARVSRVEEAKQRMRRIGESLPPGPEGVAVIRRMRDSVPSWLEGPKDSVE